jgi:hypothetical protein
MRVSCYSFIEIQQRQVKFQLRVRECDTLLRSLMSALTLHPPEKGIYESGEEYAFYNELIPSSFKPRGMCFLSTLISMKAAYLAPVSQ